MSKLFCLPSEKGSVLKGKNLLPWGSKFLPFRTDPFSEGHGMHESKLVTKVVSLDKNDRKSTKFIHFSLNLLQDTRSLQDTRNIILKIQETLF